MHPAHAPVLALYTDGAFSFAKPPDFGWVAIGPNNRPIASGCGRAANDGTNSFAGEIGAALSAIEFAVLQGVRRVQLCSDLESLGHHLQPGAETSPIPCVQRLRELLARHPDVQIEVRKVPGTHPHLTAAHHLARSAVEHLAA